MSKTKDLVGATFRTLGVSGLVASLGLIGSGCLAAQVGAGVYAGTKMAQPERKDMEEIRFSASTVSFRRNENKIKVCGGRLYRNNSSGYLLMEGYHGPCSGEPYCNECVTGNESRTFSFAQYQDLQLED